MRARFKSPTGTGSLTLPDDAVVSDIFAKIRAETGLADFSLKYGWPPQSLDISLGNAPVALLRLNGETLTVVASNAAPAKPPLPPRPAPKKAPEEATVPWPEREGILLLRVMPSDNSCLFTAFGGALPRQLPAPILRSKIAEFIMEHPEDYSEPILGMPPEQYCRRIQTADYWGGAIELSIFSALFDIEICTFNVKEKSLIRFGEAKDIRCILVYSGIHYDRVAFSAADPPYARSDFPPELDRTIWETTDDDVVDKTRLLVEGLHGIHYYTDPSDILLKCEAAGCGWIGSGQVAGQRHAKETGHVTLGEVDDETALMRCKADGCDWLGSLEEAKKHGVETGHARLTYIPDL